MKKILWISALFFLLVSCGNDNIIEENSWRETVQSEYNILALWDSLTAWYNLDYYESYPMQLQNILDEDWYNYKIINAWVSGDTSKNLLSRLSLYDEDYNLVLLNIWWNDALRSLSTSDLKENILETIDTFQNSEIVLFSIDLPANYSSSYIKDLKNVYVEVAWERNVYFYGSFFEWLDYSKHFLADWVHPNKEWYAIISEKISEYLIKNNIINKW